MIRHLSIGVSDIAQLLAPLRSRDTTPEIPNDIRDFLGLPADRTEPTSPGSEPTRPS